MGSLAGGRLRGGLAALSRRYDTGGEDRGKREIFFRPPVIYREKQASGGVVEGVILQFGEAGEEDEWRHPIMTEI
jgi:hypothetical protein